MQMQRNRKQASATRPLNVASKHNSYGGVRRLVLALLGTLGLGSTAELLGAVLALLACGEGVSFMGSIYRIRVPGQSISVQETETLPRRCHGGRGKKSKIAIVV